MSLFHLQFPAAPSWSGVPSTAPFFSVERVKTKVIVPAFHLCVCVCKMAAMESMIPQHFKISAERIFCKNVYKVYLGAYIPLRKKTNIKIVTICHYTAEDRLAPPPSPSPLASALWSGIWPAHDCVIPSPLGSWEVFDALASCPSSCAGIRERRWFVFSLMQKLLLTTAHA